MTEQRKSIEVVICEGLKVDGNGMFRYHGVPRR
jgi:hypothetical protein